MEMKILGTIIYLRCYCHLNKLFNYIDICGVIEEKIFFSFSKFSIDN